MPVAIDTSILIAAEKAGDLDESILLDLDRVGNICAIEHAKERAGIPSFSYEQVTA